MLHNCLEALRRSVRAPDEVIVVDNSSGDPATESVARKFHARYVLEEKVGLSHARNRGITESNSGILVYIDDDAVPEANWLELMLQPFSDLTIAAVTGGVVLPGSPVQPPDHQPNFFLRNHDRYWFEIAAFGGLGIGTNMALRKQACTGLSFFDERMGRGAPLNAMEEHHAFVRLLGSGYGIAVVPNAFVVHPIEERASLEEDILRMVAYLWLLFFDFPRNRRDLLSYIYRRLRHKPLTWARNSPQLGRIITCGFRLRIKSFIAGTILFWRLRNLKQV